MSLYTSIGLVAVPDTLIAVGDLITSVIVKVMSAPPPPPKSASVIVTVSFVLNIDLLYLDLLFQNRLKRLLQKIQH